MNELLQCFAKRKCSYYKKRVFTHVSPGNRNNTNNNNNNNNRIICDISFVEE